MTEVSAALLDVVEILVSRGESAIIEGMHITKGCLRRLTENPNSTAICIDNRLPFEARIDAKSHTRTRLHHDRYLAHRDHIIEMHTLIVSMYEGIEAPIIVYQNIEELFISLDRIITLYV
jgi:2-phosphoglycerate kinase